MLDAGRAKPASLPKPRLASLRTLRSPTTREVLDEAIVLRFVARKHRALDNMFKPRDDASRCVERQRSDAAPRVGRLRRRPVLSPERTSSSCPQAPRPEFGGGAGKFVLCIKDS